MSIDLAGANGRVILANGTAPLTLPAGAVSSVDVIDFVGYGTAVTREGTTAAPAASVRRPSAVTPPAPTPTRTPPTSPATPPTPEACAGCTATPLPTFTGTIAEIQGTDTDTTPARRLVTTTGVVTAKYPTGGFNGFYLQTAGTGGAVDATPGASDGIFVFSAADVDEPADLGDGVEVVGPVTEFSGLTEITAPTG